MLSFVSMKDINAAIAELFASEAFTQDATIDPLLRVYAGRAKSGKLGLTTSIRLLKQYGYKVGALGPVVKKKLKAQA